MSDEEFGVSFSKHFGVPSDWFDKNTVLDPTLDLDTLLHIDPFLLSGSKHAEFSSTAFDTYIAHFEVIFKLLLKSKEVGDLPWNAAVKRMDLSEKGGLSGTCLGYAKHSIHGHGFGPKLTERFLRSAKQIIDLGVEDPEMFSLLSLFEKDIGPDLISDMVASITVGAILDFNERVLDKLQADTGIVIPLQDWEVRGRAVKLPANPFSTGVPVLLLPSDILRALPVMDDPRQLPKIAKDNEDLRDRVGDHIQEIWKIRTKKEKEQVKQWALESPEAFQTLLDLVKILESAPYDLQNDPLGLLSWRTDSKNISALHPLKLTLDKSLPRAQQIREVCELIINQFKDLVEKNRLNRLFFVDGDPRPEKYAQLLFYGVSISYCVANDVDISPESDAGAGPVDFKMSTGNDKVVVEMKLSTNSKIVNGYVKQLEAYQDAERTDFGYYVIVDVGKLGKKLDRLLEIQKENPKFAKLRPIIYIDGQLKASASKLN